MAVLLLGLGLFLYLRLASQLDDTIDQGLRTRADEVAARIGESSIGPATANLDASPSSVSDDDESFAQVLTPDGLVVESTGQLGGAAAIGPATLAVASGGPTFVELESVPGLEGPFRALAVPVENREGTPLIELVAASLDDRDEALANLTTLLLVGGPISLLLASLAGYAAIGAALRPVEAMRVRADAITAGDSDQRLPVGSTDDELSRLAETLNAMLARLHAGIERERRFVDDASHELRTPLALHKTALELALRYETDEEGLRAAVGASVEEVDRLIQLSEDLLVVARAEDGGLALNRERTRAAALLDAVAVRFQARAEQSARAIDVEDPGDLELEVDPLRIEQALTNMVDNALRHGDGRIRLCGRAGRRRREAARRRRGPRVPAGVPRPRLRALQPRRRGPHLGRQRARAGDRRDDRRGARRAGGGGERARWARRLDRGPRPPGVAVVQSSSPASDSSSASAETTLKPRSSWTSVWLPSSSVTSTS